MDEGASALFQRKVQQHTSLSVLTSFNKYCIHLAMWLGWDSVDYLFWILVFSRLVCVCWTSISSVSEGREWEPVKSPWNHKSLISCSLIVYIQAKTTNHLFSRLMSQISAECSSSDVFPLLEYQPDLTRNICWHLHIYYTSEFISSRYAGQQTGRAPGQMEALIHALFLIFHSRLPVWFFHLPTLRSQDTHTHTVCRRSSGNGSYGNCSFEASPAHTCTVWKNKHGGERREKMYNSYYSYFPSFIAKLCLSFINQRGGEYCLLMLLAVSRSRSQVDEVLEDSAASCFARCFFFFFFFCCVKYSHSSVLIRSSPFYYWEVWGKNAD